MARLHTFDQHYLRSPRVAAELIGHSNIRKNNVVYDLGAGSGVISSVLANRAKQVVAIEQEPRALKLLRQNLQQYDNVTIIEQNILDVAPPDIPYKIFANIPFSLSSPIVERFTQSSRPPRAMYLIVQKQFARKLVPSDTHFTNLLGARVGVRFTVRIRKPLRKSDFTPPPAVDTVLLELKLREVPLIPDEQLARYSDFVGRCFHSQPFFQATPRQQANISPELRPSQLTLEQWCKLYEVVITK